MYRLIYKNIVFAAQVPDLRSVTLTIGIYIFKGFHFKYFSYEKVA